MKFYENKTVAYRISVRRRRCAVGVEGVGCGGGVGPSSEKNDFFVPKVINLGAFSRSF